MEDALRGVRPGVARAAALLALAEDVGVPLADHVHVGDRGVHVRPGVERVAEGRSKLAVAEEEPPALVALGERGYGQHCLRAAERHVRRGHLHRHPL
jgi:hypothetical protein